MRKFKAFVTDIDGTLTDVNYRISCKAIEALRLLEENGIPVILASGNCFPVVMGLKVYIGCTGAAIAENGGAIEYRGKIMILSDKKRTEVALNELKKVCKDRLVESWQNPYRLSDVAIKRTIDRVTIESVLKKFPDIKLIDSGFAYHIVSSNVSKEAGLKIACELMKISPEEVIAVGNGESDLGMMKISGYRIAVSNAHESLKKIADFVSSKEDGEGVAEGVEHVLELMRAS